MSTTMADADTRPAGGREFNSPQACQDALRSTQQTILEAGAQMNTEGGISQMAAILSCDEADVHSAWERINERAKTIHNEYEETWRPMVVQLAEVRKQNQAIQFAQDADPSTVPEHIRQEIAHREQVGGVVSSADEMSQSFDSALLYEDGFNFGEYLVNSPQFRGMSRYIETKDHRAGASWNFPGYGFGELRDGIGLGIQMDIGGSRYERAWSPGNYDSQDDFQRFPSQDAAGDIDSNVFRRFPVPGGSGENAQTGNLGNIPPPQRRTGRIVRALTPKPVFSRYIPSRPSQEQGIVRWMLETTGVVGTKLGTQNITGRFEAANARPYAEIQEITAREYYQETEQAVTIEVVGTMMRASHQEMRDVPKLTRLINNKLMGSLRRRQSLYAAFGNGTGHQWRGLWSQVRANQESQLTQTMGTLTDFMTSNPTGTVSQNRMTYIASSADILAALYRTWMLMAKRTHGDHRPEVIIGDPMAWAQVINDTNANSDFRLGGAPNSGPPMSAAGLPFAPCTEFGEMNLQTDLGLTDVGNYPFMVGEFTPDTTEFHREDDMQIDMTATAQTDDFARLIYSWRAFMSGAMTTYRPDAFQLFEVQAS